MIYEHDIPKGSKLYFGKNAKLKRKIESISAKYLEKYGYEEIITPFLSYHQEKSVGKKELIRFSDEKNLQLSLKADSTIDTVRVITKRLGRSVKHNKWYYIQPVFRYPSYEIYQVGAEQIGQEDLQESISIVLDIFRELDISPYLQISNMNIPKIISSELSLPLDVFKDGKLDEILKINLNWLNKLAYLESKEDMENFLKIAPKSIKEELERIYELSFKINYDKIIFSPLYYAQMRYYKGLYFRFFMDNKTLCKGGNYIFEDIRASGFALYVDSIIEIKDS